MSRKIRMYTAEYLPSRTASQLGSLITRVIHVYAKGGFFVRVVLMDMEFECLTDKLPFVSVNTSAAWEHVAEIERSIRTIKERARCVLAGLPFEVIPSNSSFILYTLWCFG